MKAEDIQNWYANGKRDEKYGSSTIESSNPLLNLAYAVGAQDQGNGISSTYLEIIERIKHKFEESYGNINEARGDSDEPIIIGHEVRNPDTEDDDPDNILGYLKAVEDDDPANLLGYKEPIKLDKEKKPTTDDIDFDSSDERPIKKNIVVAGVNIKIEKNF
jgi:hypothetical protein